MRDVEVPSEHSCTQTTVTDYKQHEIAILGMVNLFPINL